MSYIYEPAGAISSIFVGMAASSDVLTRILPRATEGIGIKDGIKTEYVQSLGRFVVAGLEEVATSITFYTDTDIPYLLSRSLNINSGTINDVPNPDNQYVLFLVNADQRKNSYLLSPIQVIPSSDPYYGKDNPTSITIQFVNNTPDISSIPVRRGTASQLGTYLAGRNPLSI